MKQFGNVEEVCYISAKLPVKVPCFYALLFGVTAGLSQENGPHRFVHKRTPVFKPEFGRHKIVLQVQKECNDAHQPTSERKVCVIG